MKYFRNIHLVIAIATTLYINLAPLEMVQAQSQTSPQPSSVKETFFGWETYKWNLVIKFVQTIGGLGFIVTGYLAWKSLQIAEKNRTIAERNRDLAEDQQLTDRFAKAVELLATDKLEVRIGGIYLLKRIANDSPKDHGTVMNVLTTFIIKKNSIVIESERISLQPLEADIRAAFSVISSRRIENDRELIDFNNANLERADLRGLNLSNVNFSGANLERADLRSTNVSGSLFKGASLKGTCLEGANFYKGNFHDADLTKARLNTSNLQEANLQNANLQNARLQNANLQNANLQNANLQNANLQNADLQNANLQGAYINESCFKEANLQNANLQKTMTNKTDFRGANLKNASVISFIDNADFTGADIRGMIFLGTAMPSEQEKQDFISRGAILSKSQI